MLSYTIAQGSSAQGLVLDVNDLLNKGYKPLGGVSTVAVGEYRHSITYTQAMVKEVDE